MFITTIPAFTKQQHLAAQEVASKAPPSAPYDPAPRQPVEAPSASQAGPLPDLPRAVPLVVDDPRQLLTLDADNQSRHGDLYTLEGNVAVSYHGHVVHADRITYDEATADLQVQGHVIVSGGDNDEYIQASRGNYNLRTQTGTFYDVTGSVGMHNVSRVSYSTPNPFLFSGRIIVKTGPENYDVYDGTVTSCLLPNPDWLLSSRHFSLDGETARARDSTFRLLRVPILFLPYVTHPLDAEARQSGILVPVISQSSTKGLILGEEFYFVLGRSADLTIGTQYFSARGFSESASFRYRGQASDFFLAHFSALQDRGYTPAGGVYTNQGGQDVTIAFRKQLSTHWRGVGDAEYLSSYVYREAFNENFNQAVSSDITSIVYATHQSEGFALGIRGDRYLGLKRVPITTKDKQGNLVAQPGQQVTIFHAPEVDFTAIDHRIPGTPFIWNLNSSIAGLKRSQPNFVSSGMIERLDVRPQLSLPLSGDGWHTMTSVAVRETFYSRSREAPYPAGAPPIELTTPLTRTSLDITADIRPPVIERDFHPPPFLARLFGPTLRHTVEPEFLYRNTRGIGNFLSILRFDDVDVDSNTDEIEYGVTQRLFARRRAPRAPSPCGVPSPLPAPSTPAIDTEDAEPADPSESPSGIDANGIATPDAPPIPTHSHARSTALCPPAEPQQQEWLSWKIAQKHFFDRTFGGAILNTRRNIFDATLSFSGIAFLTEPRETSPLSSRLRVRTSSHTDIEWDFDLDTGAKKFTSSNIFLDAHEGPYFGAISYARLNAPGRSYTETIDNNGVGSLLPSAISDFQQMRMLIGYGNSTKPGLSAAANVNLDLNRASVQYMSAQTGYNWNCCGLSVEYRKYELGSIRNEGTYKFNFTLANIGTAGNLRKAERLF